MGFRNVRPAEWQCRPRGAGQASDGPDVGSPAVAARMSDSSDLIIRLCDLNHAEAGEAAYIDAVRRDVVFLHPLTYCLSGLQPRVQVQEFRPVRDGHP